MIKPQKVITEGLLDGDKELSNDDVDLRVPHIQTD